ncbi:hypothetical protein IWQ56_004245 [Coemansia nantahalensis]|nr:hypothetical protein IWQ56_004245 [Coemansia nantahalensis]
MLQAGVVTQTQPPGVLTTDEASVKMCVVYTGSWHSGSSLLRCLRCLRLLLLLLHSSSLDELHESDSDSLLWLLGLRCFFFFSLHGLTVRVMVGSAHASLVGSAQPLTVAAGPCDTDVTVLHGLTMVQVLTSPGLMHVTVTGDRWQVLVTVTGGSVTVTVLVAPAQWMVSMTSGSWTVPVMVLPGAVTVTAPAGPVTVEVTVGPGRQIVMVVPGSVEVTMTVDSWAGAA